MTTSKSAQSDPCLIIQMFLLCKIFNRSQLQKRYIAQSSLHHFSCDLVMCMVQPWSIHMIRKYKAGLFIEEKMSNEQLPLLK